MQIEIGLELLLFLSKLELLGREVNSLLVEKERQSLECFGVEYAFGQFSRRGGCDEVLQLGQIRAVLLGGLLLGCVRLDGSLRLLDLLIELTHVFSHVRGRWSYSVAH